MQKHLLAAVALAAFAAVGAARAADVRHVPVLKAPPPVAPATTWTGFYVGGGVGYGLWNAENSLVLDPSLGPPFAGTALTNSINNAGKGWLGTITAGFDYQLNKQIVAGVFADYDLADIKGTLATPSANNFFDVLGGTERETSAWAAGARVGWLLTPSVLTYLTGGYTEARFSRVSINSLQSPAADFFFGAPGNTNLITPASTYHGLFVGGGIEAPLTFLPGSGWFMRSEYRYASYRGATLPIVDTTLLGAASGAGGIPTDMNFKPVVQTVRSEIVYKFNWNGPTAKVADPAAVRLFTKAPAAAAASWTGLYVGGGLGYGMWNAETSLISDPAFAPPFPGGTPLTASINNAGKGFLGTVTAGYDYQLPNVFANVLANRLVAGVFADFDLADIKGTSATPGANFFFDVLGGAEKESSAWAAGARAGWLATPNLLTYWNAGYTRARFTGISINTLQSPAANIFFGVPGVTNLSTPANTYHGWFLGGGMEAQLTILPPGWFVRSEYRYASYDSATLPIINTVTGRVSGAGAFPTDLVIKPVVQTIRSEIVYKFNWNGPVAAKF
jgi:outer membrane immunogenic protein